MTILIISFLFIIIHSQGSQSEDLVNYKIAGYSLPWYSGYSENYSRLLILIKIS
jgi:hypothetical protein